MTLLHIFSLRPILPEVLRVTVHRKGDDLMTDRKPNCSYWSKRKQEAGEQNGHLQEVTYLEDLAATHPTLAAFLTGGWVDGAFVAGGTLLVSVGVDGAKIGLHDRELDKMAWRTSDNWKGLLDEADEAADTDPGKWRKPSRQYRRP